MHLDVPGGTFREHACWMSGSPESGSFRDTGTAGVWSFERSYRTGATRSVMDPSHLMAASHGHGPRL
eukprot:2571969-Prymnesium_polylepis.1